MTVDAQKTIFTRCLRVEETINDTLKDAFVLETTLVRSTSWIVVYKIIPQETTRFEMHTTISECLSKF